MSPLAAAVVLAWCAIVFLVLALATVVRVVRLQEAQLRRLISEPRRMLPGDELKLPALLRRTREPFQLLIFGKADCGSCVAAVDTFAEHLEGESSVNLAVLWQQEAGTAHGAVQSIDYQQRLFNELRIGLLPFAVFVAGTRIAASGAVGSKAAIDELWQAIAQSIAAEGATVTTVRPRDLEVS